MQAKHAVTCSKREQMQKELAELQVWKQAQPQRPASASAGGVAPRDVMDKVYLPEGTRIDQEPNRQNTTQGNIGIGHYCSARHTIRIGNIGSIGD